MIPLVLFVVGLVAVASTAAGRGEAGFAPARVGETVIMPGPMVVLGQLVRRGQMPPPILIMCAIAEAEAMGRPDLASAIVRTFVEPVVRQHQARTSSHAPEPAAPQYAATEEETPPPAVTMTDEQIRQALDANPQQFVNRPWEAPAAQPAPFMETSENVIDVQATERVPEPTPQLGSPIVGVSIDKWSLFCNRLERETPLYQSQRHVGQYRQRKERLQELGIDPKAVLGNATAQREALNADLADAHHHVTESGLADDHIGRLIQVPGHSDAHRITLSGVLGVIQSAGLDGAVGWLETKSDRIKFPHTTAAFVRTNGMF